MKQLLEQLGFKDENGVYLPMLSEFVNRLRNSEARIVKLTLEENWIYQYADFITQPLTKGMFIPCDEDGNVLERPVSFMDDFCHIFNDLSHIHEDWEDCKQLQQAKERVLFDNKLKSQKVFLDDVDYYLSSRNGKLWINGTTTIEQFINQGGKLYLI